MANNNFQHFLDQLHKTNATLDYWTDFTKVELNVERIEINLHTLNYLLGKSNLEDAINDLWNTAPKTFEVLPILIACRGNNTQLIREGSQYKSLQQYLTSPKEILDFLEGTGLAQVFRRQRITNLVDYVFGIEVGLDTNARKNRVGKIMEYTIEAMLQSTSITYRKEVYSTEWEEIDKVLGTDKKRFDFVIEMPTKTYLMETNFYSTSGSKLNEVARSYCELSEKVSQVKNFEFVWVTDGQGWNGAKSKLEEAYNTISHLYNLTTFPNFLATLT